eukprot:c24095_g1_i1 orf=135-2744(+)
MSSRKRKRNVQKKAPLLPPDVAKDDIDISDEDLSFVAKHRQYAGFLSKLDTSTITKQVLGLKSSKKEEDNLEAYYEKRAKLVPKAKDEDMQANLVDPVDVLPVKTLSGELHYRNTKSKSQLEKEGKEEALLSLEERKVLVRTKIPINASQQPLKSDGQANGVAEKKLTKAELRKERKSAKKEKQPLSNGSSTLNHTIKAPSHISALEELEQDLSEEERVEEVKARMAELGTAVLADPENNLESLSELQGFCTHKDTNIAGMAMLSLLAVFKDIVPGYRIRVPTQKELEMQVSKEVKKLRDFETKLLKFYQKYVQVLIKAVKSVSLWKPATRCVCGLLEAIPHFNFRDSLLSATIPLMDSTNSDCRTMSCNAVRSLFQNEGKHGGSATVESVEMIADLIKTEKCVVRPDALEVFLSLSFDEDLHRRAQEQEKEKESNTRGKNFKHQEKDKKADKKAKKRQLAATLRDEVVADFREACALPEASERQKLQTQTLTAVFETFFRILKTSLNPVDSAHDSIPASSRAKLAEYGPRPLLRPCLDGLAKFSHLVSVEFMGDLLAILKRLAAGFTASPGGEVQNAIPLGFTDRLHCCVVAFRIVRSNLDALNIDLREFYVSLYNLLLCHSFIRDEHDGLVLAEALQVMLWESRQHDMQRVAAFVKRLASESLHLGPAEAMSALVTVRHLLHRYKKCCNLLENEDGGGVACNLAVLQVEGADPDMSGALSSVLWEVSLLSRHYHPSVAKVAAQISNMAASSETLQAVLTPKEAIAVYSTNRGGFNPSVQLPKSKIKKKNYLSHYGSPLKAAELDDGIHDAAPDNCDKESDGMFLSHFKVLQGIKENEALRTELNRTLQSIGLYKKFKVSRRQKHRKI